MITQGSKQDNYNRPLSPRDLSKTATIVQYHPGI